MAKCWYFSVKFKLIAQACKWILEPPKIKTFLGIKWHHLIAFMSTFCPKNREIVVVFTLVPSDPSRSLELAQGGESL